MRKYSLCVKKNNILGEYSSFLSQALFTPRLNKLVSKRPVNIIWRHFKTVAVFSLRTAKNIYFVVVLVLICLSKRLLTLFNFGNCGRRPVS